ncbi:MAG: hypothetical protein JST54_35815 [Deltaproteobacteria bacterium]|nr:hypothetical protein [Deltaproteobacteria bacterium]
MRRLALAFVALAACSNEKQLAQVHARYEPPNGFELTGEVAGPPARASFRPGLTLTRYTTDLPPGASEDAVAAALPKLADLGGGWDVASARAGTLPVGPVFRVELRRYDGVRALHYVVPRARGFLLLSFSAPEATYGPLEARVERSLNSLKADP